MRDTTSDSAKTVQVELTESDRVARRERSPIRSRSISSVLAITSRNLRVSPHFYNTPEEIDRFFAILREERRRA